MAWKLSLDNIIPKFCTEDRCHDKTLSKWEQIFYPNANFVKRMWEHFIVADLGLIK